MLEDVVSKVQGTTTTTREALAGIVRTGLEEGVGADEIAGRISAQFTDWKGWRAKLVAQTSVTPTFAVAQQDAFVDGGVTRNRWLSQRDGKVRPEHDALDGEEVEVGRGVLERAGVPAGAELPVRRAPVLGPAEKAVPRPWRAERDERVRADYPALQARARPRRGRRRSSPRSTGVQRAHDRAGARLGLDNSPDADVHQDGSLAGGFVPQFHSETAQAVSALQPVEEEEYLAAGVLQGFANVFQRGIRRVRSLFHVGKVGGEVGGI